MVYADVWRPAARAGAWLYDVAVIVCASLFVGMMAQVAVPVVFSPVPITGQTMAVLLVGTLLGWRRGGASLLLYLAQGAMGWPVFAAGTAGPAVVAGPTGGYLVGFVAAAVLTGWLAERGWDRRTVTTAGSMMLGNIVIYLAGLSWLAGFVGSDQVLKMGLFPYLVGDLIKILGATALLPTAWRLVRDTRR